MLLTGYVLWDYIIDWVCETKIVAPNSLRYWNGHTDLEVITGDTPCLNEYPDFAPYYWVIFRSNTCMRPVEIGIYIGVNHKVRWLISYQVLAESSITISCMTVKQLFYLENKSIKFENHME